MASQFFEASVRVKADGVEVFHPAFVAQASLTADIRQMSRPDQAVTANDDGSGSNGDSDRAPRGGQRLLLTANPRGVDVYSARVEYMEFRNGTWVTVLQPSLRVRQDHPATLSLTGADGRRWEMTLILSPRHDIGSFSDLRGGFTPSGLLDCEMPYSFGNHAVDLGVGGGSGAQPSYFPVGPGAGADSGDCCDVDCSNGQSMNCCNACCVDPIGCPPGNQCCAGTHP